MKNKKVILLLISLTLLAGIVQPGAQAVFAEESAFTGDTESGFYAEANQPYLAPEVPAEEEPVEKPEEEPVEEPEEKPVDDNKLIQEKTKNYGTADAPVMGYENAACYARFESNTADLIITKENMDEGQSSIFDVTGPDGYSKRIVINGSSPVTIKGLKSGTYTVTEVTAWQHTAGSNSQSVTLQSSQSSTVCFTDNRSSHQWLSGNAYNRITFGN